MHLFAERGKSVTIPIRITIAAGLVTLGMVAAQQAPDAATASQPTPAYDARCLGCHGQGLKGTERGPAILQWVRYHTDKDLTPAITLGKGKMPAQQLSADELKTVLSDLRVLAGTNPLMATGGFAGVRAAGRGGRGGRGGGRGGAAAPTSETTPLPGLAAKAIPDRTGQQATISVTGGAKLTGKVLTDYENAATILTADGKIHLLARAGDAYTEKKLDLKADWATYHGQIGGNRYSTLDQINASNVANLKPAWAFPVPQSAGAGRAIEATPLVVDGIMYFTGWNAIYALDATTGQELWSYSQPHTEGIVSDAGAGANRGAAISGDRVIMSTDHAHLICFNRKTGEKLWDREMGDYREMVSNSGAPMIVGDMVISGMSGGEEGARGFVDAYQISTGERMWRFWTIPTRNDPEAKTWIGAALEHGCGPTWLTGSYDTQLDTLYWAIGNPCPDMTGDERKGDNLYTNSVVALSPKTGKMKWYYQFTPHDTHDWDSVEPMLLVDEQWQGKPRKLLMHGDRNGMFYVLDRTNGQFLAASKLSTKVSWNDGYTKEGKPLLNSTFESSPAGTATCPTLSGGANWQSSAYNPKTKLFYARVIDGCGIYQSGPDPLNNGRWFGRGAGPSAEAQNSLKALTEGYKTASYIRAIDPFTGIKVWDYEPNGRTGVLTTAGGLVFIGDAGGMGALDASTGQKLWGMDFAQNSTGNAMTYMVGGKQYVALSGAAAMISYALP